MLVRKTLTRDWQQLTALRTKPLTDKAMESFQLLASYDGCFLDLAACGRDLPRISKTDRCLRGRGSLQLDRAFVGAV